MDLSNIGKLLIYAGIGLALIGLVVFLLSKLGMPLGNFPGDIKYERPGFSFSFPIVTSILISIVLTILVNVIFWFFRK